MIRFNCPHCNRYYELPPALAMLPLLCKQCGQRFIPPAPDPSAPPPAPVVPARPPATAKPAPEPQAAGPQAAPKPPLPDDADGGMLVTQPEAGPYIDFNVGGPTAASLSDANRPRPPSIGDAPRRPPSVGDATEPDINLDLLGPAPPPAPPRPAPAPEPEPPPEPKAEPTLGPFVADLLVFVLLVGGGMFIGELLAQKPTGQVLAETASPKFPPVDLILWAGPPVMFGLIYLLLGARKRTVGEWLRRRRAAQ